MRRLVTAAGIGIALLTLGVGTAAASDLTIDRLLSICDAPTVLAATAQGDALGWQRLTDAETADWRTSFLSYNGGTVDIVGWQRKAADKADSLSFWLAVGPNGHKACTYSTNKPEGLLDALSEKLGPPEHLEKQNEIETTTAAWTRGAVEYSYAQVGSSALVAVGPSR